MRLPWQMPRAGATEEGQVPQEGHSQLRWPQETQATPEGVALAYNRQPQGTPDKIRKQPLWPAAAWKARPCPSVRRDRPGD